MFQRKKIAGKIELQKEYYILTEQLFILIIAALL
jgi:hypothetical protein